MLWLQGVELCSCARDGRTPECGRPRRRDGQRGGDAGPGPLLDQRAQGRLKGPNSRSDLQVASTCHKGKILEHSDMGGLSPGKAA